MTPLRLTCAPTARRLVLALAPLLALAAGCMGTPTREILVPNSLKGARMLVDGDVVEEVKQGISYVVPLVAGVQAVRVEPARGPALVQRMRIFVNDDKAERTGVNVLVARIDQGALHRTVLAWPDDPLKYLGHDFEPPGGAEGVILLSSQADASVTIDGKPLPAPLVTKKGSFVEYYVTRGTAFRLTPGKHRIEFAKAGFETVTAEVETVRGEYEVIGATLPKAQAAATIPPAAGGG